MKTYDRVSFCRDAMAILACVFAFGASNARSSCPFRMQTAATIRFRIFLIYEAAKKTASILFVPQMKHDSTAMVLET